MISAPVVIPGRSSRPVDDPAPGSRRGFPPRSHRHAWPRAGPATVARRLSSGAPSGQPTTHELTIRSTRSDTKPGTASHKQTRCPKLSTKIGSCTQLPTLCMVRAITHSAGRVREPATDVRLHVGQGSGIPPLPVKWSTVSGRGRGADDAPARLHRTPLGPEGRAARPGRHSARSVQGALDRSQIDIGIHPCNQRAGSIAPKNERSQLQEVKSCSLYERNTLCVLTIAAADRYGAAR
jgi:hypothetical protein